MLAAGAWSAPLPATLGLAVDVRPVRGPILLLRGEPGLIGPTINSDDSSRIRFDPACAQTHLVYDRPRHRQSDFTSDFQLETVSMRPVRLLRPAAPVAKPRRQKGLALVEVALTLPLLLALLSGIVQFGGLFFVQNTMINVARDVTRRLAVGEINPGQVQPLVQAGLSSWTQTFTVDVHTPDPDDSSDHDVWVEIKVPKKNVSLMDLFGMFQSGNLTAKVTMRQEEDLS